jgi:hypothetical protein
VVLAGRWLRIWLILAPLVQGAEGGYGTRVVTVNNVLDGHIALDVECVDRIYLNGCWRGLAREQRPAVTKALAGIS